jgi:Fe-S cluster assembly protein SufD
MSTETFLAHLHTCFDTVAGDALTKIRAAAWDHFLELGLPDKTHDSYQYVPLRHLYEAAPIPAELVSCATAPYLHPECKGATLVFINGHYAPQLSDLSSLPKQVVVLPLAHAVKSYGPFLESRWKKTLHEERDPLAVLNLAVHSSGLFFYVPPHVKIETPIQALFVGTENSLAPARLHVFLAPQANVQWISTVIGPALHNIVLDVSLDEESSFEETETSLPSSGWHLKFLRSTLKKRSRLRYFNIGCPQRHARHSLQALLQEEGADVLFQGVSHLKTDAQVHTHIRIEHIAPHTHSLQKFKNVLEDLSQSSFSGKIFVHPTAEKTEAYQLNQNLLLSPGAIAQAKPNLEIFNPDVKASHGATMAQIDPEHLFYLQSRGLSLERAQHLLVRGFIQEMLAQIPHPFLRTHGLTL